MDGLGNPVERVFAAVSDTSFPATERLVLPSDVLMLPASDLDVALRSELSMEADEYAVTRIGARTPSRIIDGPAAALLAEFRTPTTIVQAVIRFSRAQDSDPRSTLDAAFPLLQQFVAERLLVAEGSSYSKPLGATLERGAEVGGFVIQDVVQVLEDTEVYRAGDGRGRHVALKVARVGARASLARRFDREAAILRNLDGRVNAGLLATGHLEDRPYLCVEWFSGVPTTHAVDCRPHRASAEDDAARLVLCRKIVASYVHLHTQGVLHGDVHPRNVLIGDDSSIRIIDFGFAMHEGLSAEPRSVERGGVDFYVEPEYARARLAGHRPPPVSALAEQYSVAALLYELLTGCRYVQFSPDKHKLRQQIVEEKPLSFASVGRPPWPALEQVLDRALAKQPGDRFPSMAAFADELALIRLPRDYPTRSTHRRAGIADDGDRLVETALEAFGWSSPLFLNHLPAPMASVNYGAAGVAYFIYRIACQRQDPPLLSLADAWCDKAAAAAGDDERAFVSQDLGMSSSMVGATSVYHGIGGIHLVRALISQAMGDAASQQAAINEYIEASRATDRHLDLALGKSGSLLGCALMLEAARMEELLDRSPLMQRGDELAEEILLELNARGPISQGTTIGHLGIAHGWAGMLYAILKWCGASRRTISPRIEERLEQLADLAQPSGKGIRWPIRLHSSGRHGDRGHHSFMSGWCNGSAGYVHLWTLARELTGEERYVSLAEGAAWTAWSENDSLATLCCGLAGRAYALLNAHGATRERIWLDRASELANGIEVDVTFANGFSHSLFKGSLGPIVLLSDIQHLADATFPVFESEAWSV